jgi:hypothetical protein
MSTKWVLIGASFVLAVNQTGGDSRVRTWLPEYPGSHAKGVLALHSYDGENEAFTFTTQDSAGQVASFYGSAFQSAGLSVNRGMFASGAWGVHFIAAQDSALRRVAYVTASVDGSEATTVRVTYATGK